MRDPGSHEAKEFPILNSLKKDQILILSLASPLTPKECKWLDDTGVILQGKMIWMVLLIFIKVLYFFQIANMAILTIFHSAGLGNDRFYLLWALGKLVPAIYFKNILQD